MKEEINNNQKGITLIALVITIIVLLILAGVAISMLSGENGILRQAANAKTETEKQSTLEQIRLAALSAITNPEHKIKSEGDLLTALQQQGLNVTAGNVTGDVDTGYKVTVNGETYNVTTSGSIEKAITFSKTGDLAIGSEVTASNGEKFYVIGGDEVGTAISDSTQKVLLLAKYNLKKEGTEITLKQDTTGEDNPCIFSDTAYWKDVTGIAYPDANGKYPDLNDETKYPIGNSTSIITVANNYGTSLGGDGDLLTWEDLAALGGKRNEDSYSGEVYYDLSECPDFIKTQKYWLGSASSKSSVLIVEGNSIGGPILESGAKYGVRPVIEVLKSSIE